MSPVAWQDVPLTVRGVEAVAKILGRSVRQIERALATGRMRPPPLARQGREAWRWSKDALQKHLAQEAGARGLRRIA